MTRANLLHEGASGTSDENKFLVITVGAYMNNMATMYLERHHHRFLWLFPFEFEWTT